jgi:hypothetical protein
MSELFSMDRSRVVVSTLRDQGADHQVAATNPAELMGMVWQLTLDAWAFKEPSRAESRLQRDVISVVRGRG